MFSDAQAVDVVPVSEAAELLDCSRMTIIRGISSGRFDGGKIGHGWFVTKASVLAAVEAQRAALDARLAAVQS
jgi:excisionase family DNA binding protein